MDGTCAGCRHWRPQLWLPSGVPEGWRACEVLSAEDSPHAVALVQDGCCSYVVHTGPEFGCAAFSAGTWAPRRWPQRIILDLPARNARPSLTPCAECQATPTVALWGEPLCEAHVGQRLLALEGDADG